MQAAVQLDRLLPPQANRLSMSSPRAKVNLSFSGETDILFQRRISKTPRKIGVGPGWGPARRNFASVQCPSRPRFYRRSPVITPSFMVLEGASSDRNCGKTYFGSLLHSFLGCGRIGKCKCLSMLEYPPGLFVLDAQDVSITGIETA